MTEQELYDKMSAIICKASELNREDSYKALGYLLQAILNINAQL